jgi:hypothetical protein
MCEGWDGTVDFTFDGRAFRLQNYYVADWANNFMILIDAGSVDIWRKHAVALLESKAVSGMGVKAPEAEDESLVLHVWDPTGAMLIFVR